MGFITDKKALFQRDKEGKSVCALAIAKKYEAVNKLHLEYNPNASG